MLDVIADFWKPVKKAQPQEKLQPEMFQVGSSITFGYVPQAMLSGRRLQISAINTYQFGDETLTSFVLAQDKEPGVSMIVAETEGEHYFAISRRVSINDRMKLFDSTDLENIIGNPEVTKLACKSNNSDFKGWVVASYKRELQGLKGRIFAGDYRKKALPPIGEGQEFEYTLLVSEIEDEEHAIEIERYQDGRVELYATVYRRMNDIGDITHPGGERARADIKLASSPDAKVDTPAPKAAPAVEMPRAVEGKDPVEEQKPMTLEEVEAAPLPPEGDVFPAAPEASVAPEATPLAVESDTKKPDAPTEGSVEAPLEAVEAAIAEKPAAQTQPEQAAALPDSAAEPVALFSETSETKEEPSPMANIESAINGTANTVNTNLETQKSKLYVQPTAPDTYIKQEVKAVTNNGTASNFDSESIECDLRVANKIIDEAIRNEMRLTDIVRRIIELPVAYPESVQIPVTLTDEDYALLGIRYGIPAVDRTAIKRRILEDLNDFSGSGGNGKKAA